VTDRARWRKSFDRRLTACGNHSRKNDHGRAAAPFRGLYIPLVLTARSPDRFSSLTCELQLICDRRGVITFANERAKEALGDCEGRTLASLSVDDGHAQSSFARVVEGDDKSFEIALVTGGRPRTFMFRGRADGDEVLFVGSPVPEPYVRAFREVDGVMRELGDMHRESERQRISVALKNEELVRLNQELSDSHRGLVSLHAEVDEKSHALRRESDIKGRVVANVSHEFRTPLNSILGISQLLLNRMDGDLTAEQEKQLQFIRTSAQGLSELVNDLLDLSRIEAGKTDLRVRRFSASDLTGALRGMMRPLATNDAVELTVEEPKDDFQLESDEGKISQVLRNLVSNALKFTEKGSVSISVEQQPGDLVVFRVKDTGIGIGRDDTRRVFQEFVQIDSPIQRKVRGTGLGLSLSRRLAEMLGGSLTVESELGKGSTFTLAIPRVHVEVRELERLRADAKTMPAGKVPVLVVEDHRQTLFLYEKYLARAGFQTVPARTVEEAREVLGRLKPAAIVLDVMLEGESTWQFLAELKENEETRNIPVMVVTVVDRAQKARALGADEFWLKPVDPDRLLSRLAELSKKTERIRVLVIDDDEASRYIIRRHLEATPYELIEAENGPDGIRLARTRLPHLILLDFVLGENTTAFDVLDDLKVDPSTRHIPVIIQTAKQLDEAERAKLSRETASILSKQNLSRELAIARIREALVAAGVQSEVTP
jgi:signal transduction histidine kinase/CheY-like chemotaxis protein